MAPIMGTQQEDKHNLIVTGTTPSNEVITISLK